MNLPTKAMFQRFPHEQLLAAPDATAEDRETYRNTGNQLAAAIDRGVFWSLGASEIAAIPGTYERGGLVFTARIRAIRDGVRLDRASLMAVMVSLNGADLIDVTVRELARGTDHTTINDLYIDQVGRALLALDYDGNEALNPRYWS